MRSLKYIDKQHMVNLFGIKNGYVFSYLKNGYSKTTTRDMILEATGIDIYSNPDYNLSQERCIRKIWDECDDVTNGKLLKVLLDYFDTICDWSLSHSEEVSYKRLRVLEKELLSSNIEVPDSYNDDLQLIHSDIQKNITNGTPELVLDRLHTFATKYFRMLCTEHNISTKLQNGGDVALHSLVGNLAKWYETNLYFESDFCVIAIKNAISVFEKFNDIRNNHSAAHANIILNKIEAEYVVGMIADTLMFIDKIEKCKKESTEQALPWDNGIIYYNYGEEKLPF